MTRKRLDYRSANEMKNDHAYNTIAIHTAIRTQSRSGGSAKQNGARQFGHVI